MKYLKFLIVITLATGCGGTQKEEVVNELPKNYDPILTPYFSIVDALIDDDFDKARQFAMELSRAESTNGVTLALVRMGALMNESSSLYDQRYVLEQLGMVIPLYIEQSVVNDYLIYKFKCKNEFSDKEVVWLGLTKETRNPFIGENSTNCIELIETIEPVIKK